MPGSDATRTGSAAGVARWTERTVNVIPFCAPARRRRPLEGATGEVRYLHPRPGRSASAEGGVLRGERAVYGVVARPGQVLSVEVEALEDNAAVELLPPGGRPLPQAPDQRGWSGSVPEAGLYLVSVGPTRGNADYRLRVGLG